MPGLLSAFDPRCCPRSEEQEAVGVHSVWLIANIEICPEDATDRVVQRYARSWLWHMATDLLFSNLIQCLCN
jgi:hypothetical protein